MTDFRQALVEVRKVLQIANDLEDGPIYDTIWMTNGMTTLFDFIDATLAAQPPELDAQNVDKLMDLVEVFATHVRYHRYEFAHLVRKELRTALRAAITPHPVALPMPGSPEASAMIDTMLERYQYPANMKNAARAGYEAARALLATPHPAPKLNTQSDLGGDTVAAATRYVENYTVATGAATVKVLSKKERAMIFDAVIGLLSDKSFIASLTAPEPTMPQWPEGPVRKQTIGEAFEAWRKEK